MNTCHICDNVKDIIECVNCAHVICENCSFKCYDECHLHGYDIFCKDCTITCSSCNNPFCELQLVELTEFICNKCTSSKLKDIIKERDVLLKLYLKKIMQLIPDLTDIIIQYYH